MFKAVGRDRVGVIETAYKPGRVFKRGLLHETPTYLVNWGSVVCYESHDNLISALDVAEERAGTQ